MSFAGPAVVAHLRRDARFLRDLRHEARLADVVRQRLLAVHVLAGLHRENRDVRVQVIRCRDENRVDRLLLLEHDSEVFVGRAGVVRGLLAVVLLDFLLHREPAALAAVVPVREVPLLRRVGHGDDLTVVLLEQGASVGPALSARADDGDVHLVARRDEARSAENVAGDDGESGRGGGGGRDELSAGRG